MSATEPKTGTPVARDSSRTVPESSITKSVRAFQRALPQFGVPPPRTVAREQSEQRRREEQLQTHRVYFLYCCGRIKIGTSNNHMRRIMQEIMPYCPVPIDLLGIIPGGKFMESSLHERFSASSLDFEWFDLTPELRDFLCEDEGRRKSLQRAEAAYLEWLRGEIFYLEKANADV